MFWMAFPTRILTGNTQRTNVIVSRLNTDWRQRVAIVLPHIVNTTCVDDFKMAGEPDKLNQGW